MFNKILDIYWTSNEYIMDMNMRGIWEPNECDRRPVVDGYERDMRDV